MSRPAHNSTPTGFRTETRNIMLARVVTVICLDCVAMSFYKKDRLSKYSDLLCKNSKGYKNNFPSCSLCLSLSHSRFTHLCVCVCVMFPPLTSTEQLWETGEFSAKIFNWTKNICPILPSLTQNSIYPGSDMLNCILKIMVCFNKTND